MLACGVARRGALQSGCTNKASFYTNCFLYIYIYLFVYLFIDLLHGYLLFLSARLYCLCAEIWITTQVTDILVPPLKKLLSFVYFIDGRPFGARITPASCGCQ